MSARCPICTMELADVNAVRQHTRAEHGTAAHDSSEGWTSVAGPGPEGWYPDPWNSKSQRYWDGSQWSGKTAPLDAPQEPATPQPAMAGATGLARLRAPGLLAGRSNPERTTAAGPVPPPVVSEPTAPPAPFAQAGVDTGAGELARPAGAFDAATVDGAAVEAAPVDAAPVEAAAGSFAPAAGAWSAPAGADAPSAGALDASAGSFAPPAAPFDAGTGSFAPPVGGAAALPPPPVGDLGQAPSTPPLAPSAPPLGPPPLGPAPGAGGSRPPMPKPSRTPGSVASMARRLPPAVWGAVAAAVVVLVIVIVISGVSSSSPQPVGIPANSPVTTAPSGPTGMAAGVLSAADVGVGWTAYPAGHALTAAQAAAGPCHSPLWNGNLGGYESSFINGTSAAAAHGAVVSEVFEAKSVAAATAQQQFIASGAFLPCLEQKVTGEVESQFPKGAGWAVTGDVANPFQLQLGDVSATGWVLMVSVKDGFGSTSVLTDDSVEIFTGPYEATLDVSWNSKAPLTQQIVQAQATTEAQHLAALPVAGTLAPPG